MSSTAVRIGPHGLEGELQIPAGSTTGLVMFAHGSGSSRLSPRNQSAARALQAHGLGTLLFDLLTDDEARDRRNVFDIELLAGRLGDALDWQQGRADITRLPPDCLVPAPERQQRWWRRPNTLTASAPWYPAAAGRISPASSCSGCTRLP